MIQYIRGELASVESDRVVVDVGGVGYGIFMSPTAFGLLPPPGEEVKIYTYLNVKEDALQLYGFLTRDDLEIFRLLIQVNGVGPKGALGILSELSANDLRFAVLSEDAKAIAGAPGIGKKTAEKIILELKDKLNIEDTLADASGAEGTLYADSSAEQGIVSDAVEALVSLGYGNTEALKAVQSVNITEDMSANELLKQALKALSF